jgi:hypothetical protein
MRGRDAHDRARANRVDREPTAVVDGRDIYSYRGNTRTSRISPVSVADDDCLGQRRDTADSGGVIDPPRARITDCAPPGWKPPSELKGFVAPPFPADRPKPIVDDYLKYVVTAPPQEIVDRFKLDTAFYRKYAGCERLSDPRVGARVSMRPVAIVRDQVQLHVGQPAAIRDTMIAHGGRVVVMAETEYTVDVPEQRGWVVPKYLDPRLTPQERARAITSRADSVRRRPRATGIHARAAWAER